MLAVAYKDGTNESDTVFLDNGKDMVVNATATDTQLLMNDLLKLDSEPVFSVALDDLAPCLKNQELPLRVADR